MHFRPYFLAMSLVSTFAFADEAQRARLDEKHRAFLQNYCVSCHGAEKQSGALRLDDVSFTLDTVENADRWQKVLAALNSREMPPEDAKQPHENAKADFLDALSHTLVTARKTLGDQGRVGVLRQARRVFPEHPRHRDAARS